MKNTKTQDAFGLLLTHHFAGESCEEFIERDDGYLVSTGNLPAYFAPYTEWPLRFQQAMNFVRGRVLDVGVGAGRFALYLQELGHEVVGIDVSPGALEICRKRGVEIVHRMPFHKVDASLGTFDTVLMMGNNFGLFASPGRAKWMLRRLKNLTRENARIVAESLDIYGTEKPEHLAYHARNRHKGRMAGEIRLRVRYRELIGDWFDYLMVSQPEMQGIVEGTGWRVVEFIGGEGGQYVGVIEKES